MKVSFGWLDRYVSIDLGLEKLVESLTMLGLEVESVFDRFDFLRTVVVGQIDEVVGLSGSGDFSLCTVNCGSEIIDVVCNAKNIYVGLMVPVALCGTVMPSGDIIREKKIRRCSSFGVLCSEGDLAVGAVHDCVMLLDEVKVGQSMREVLSVSDYVLEIALTPNRSDCTSVIGIAREIAALQSVKLKPFPKGLALPLVNDTDGVIQANIVPLDKCKCYTIVVFENFKIIPSPFWLQDSLIAIGLKPVNVVVDVINFVMIETGQPLHAFDFESIEGKCLVVDVSRGGEKFKALNGAEFVLPEGILAVFNSGRPISVAGVIGSSEYAITAKTRKIVIESAYFDPYTVRKASKTLGITTEASYRFERGVDPDGVVRALSRAAALILDVCDGSEFVSLSRKDDVFKCFKKVVIKLDVNVMNQILGITLTPDRVISLLASIEFSSNLIEKNTLEVRVPSFRVDIKRAEDLMEEVARLYGYDNIPVSFPALSTIKNLENSHQNDANIIRSVMNGIGFSEVINYSFTDSGSHDRLGLPDTDYRKKKVSIINPISSAYSVMQISLIPSFMEIINRNISRQVKDLMLFEIGKIFISNGENNLPDEIEMLTAVWTGSRIEPSWSDKKQFCDFFDIKGSLEELMAFLKVGGLRFSKFTSGLGRYMCHDNTAQVFSNDCVLGLVGELASEFLKTYEIKQRVFTFEIELEKVYQCLPKTRFVDPVPLFPSVSRDATVIIDEGLEAGCLLDRLRDLDEKLVEDIRLVDIFRGPPIQNGMKSVSFRVVYRSKSKTLDDNAVSTLHKRLIDFIVREFTAILP